MRRTRIRWRNVGRLAGGVAVGAVALFAGADLLEPPPPQPLPADVGLATGASGVQGVQLPAREPRERDKPAPRPPREARRPQRRAEAHPADVNAAPERHVRDRTTKKSSREREDSGPAVVAASPAPPPTPVAPAPATPQPAPPPPPPAPAPETDPQPGDVQAEFGFEPTR